MTVPSHPAIEGFDVLQTNYKTVGDHGIRADILIPKASSKAEKHPVMIKFHGGGLVFGDSLFMDWWPRWLSDLALKHDAVIISPNYRLLPEASTTELYQDVEDFWSWVHSSTLKDLLVNHTTPTELDLGRVLTAGESAGGLLSIQAALSHPLEIRAALASYPMLAPELEHYNKHDPNNTPFGNHIPEDAFTAALEAVKGSNAISSSTEMSRMMIAGGSIEYGKLGEIYARDVDDDALYPFKRIEQPGVSLPRGGLAIIHGRQDTMVPMKHTEAFVERARDIFKGTPGGDKIAFTVRDGEHGFDGTAALEDEWLQDNLKAAVKAWLE